MMRGINRQSIFEDDEDYSRFLQTLQNYKEKSGYEIYAYCLMGNHVHLLLKVGKEPLEQIMRRICGSYVYWYNVKYERIGNLFQDRFKSEAVENDGYFLTVLRYIHQNPLKAGMVNSVEDYRWSSLAEYMKRPKVVDVSFVLKLFDDKREKAVELIIQFCKVVNDDQCLEMERKHLLSDQEARQVIKKVCQIEPPSELQKLDKVNRNQYLKELKENRLSIRQIERLTGINRGIVLKA
ncbi:MAG: transposase [Desulfosporosinus sp.]|nr:transposase [Desulfosporosinus sp.]